VSIYIAHSQKISNALNRLHLVNISQKVLAREDCLAANSRSTGPQQQNTDECDDQNCTLERDILCCLISVYKLWMSDLPTFGGSFQRKRHDLPETQNVFVFLFCWRKKWWIHSELFIIAEIDGRTVSELRTEGRSCMYSRIRSLDYASVSVP